jgi:SAM-dependent methyltransferase
MNSQAERFFRESEYWRAWSDVPDMTADIAYALEALNPGDRRILDIPCGRGRLLRTIQELLPEAELYGLDINEHMIALVTRELPRVKARVGSVFDIPFPDRTFDAVLCHESFMHFDRPDAALAELSRVARRRLYLSVTTRRQLNTLLRRLRRLPPSDVPHWTYNYEDVVRMLPDAFAWEIRGAFLIGRKTLGLSHAAHLQLHRLVGRHLPQWLLRRYGQSLFLYGTRKEGA